MLKISANRRVNNLILNLLIRLKVFGKPNCGFITKMLDKNNTDATIAIVFRKYRSMSKNPRIIGKVTTENNPNKQVIMNVLVKEELF